jgi:hypothetical protein
MTPDVPTLALRLHSMPDLPFHVEPWIRCPPCGAALTIQDRYTTEYFEGTSVLCPRCGASLDWWTTVLLEIRQNFLLRQAFAPIGARHLIFPITLRSEERTHYKLSDHGVPANAKILYVNYTPEAPIHPVEIPGGNITTRRPNRHEVTMWPVPWENVDVADVARTAKVTVSVSWVPHSPLDASWENLVTAFEAYVAADYAAAIVPANVAVEAALSVFLFDYLARYKISGTHIKPFLDDAATYGHQLNVLLPLVAEWSGAPRLPDHIRGALNRLRGLRNDIAHRGRPDVPLIQAEAAELLCAALFGFRYVGLVQSRIPQSDT